jgi:DNA helicase-2/ATP-dependent DNA helicase PcrA
MNIIVGPPGTGKTTTLLSLVEDYLASGVKPQDIAYLAFTRKAANEARDRASNKFKLPPKDFVNFRTIHSLAFYLLGLKKEQVMRRQHYEELGDILGIDITGHQESLDGTTYGMSNGDRLIFLEGLSRIKGRDLHDVWRDADEEDFDWWELERVARALKKFKADKFLLDFTDMLSIYLNQGYVPKFQVLFIDEAQDLSPLQWRVVETLIDKAEEVYVAGDDDQAIFTWAGADVEYFINLSGTVTTLSNSYRLPRKVLDVANAVINDCVHRRPKVLFAKDSLGRINYYNGPDEIDMDTGNWLLLARNGYMLTELEKHCQMSGYSYDSIHKSPRKSPALEAIKQYEKLRSGKETTEEGLKLAQKYSSKPISSSGDIWHKALDKMNWREREYFMAARRRGESLVGDARIKISTIHGAKGGEADNVVVLTDVAKKVYDAMQVSMDNEARVFYVAVTRAKENLHIVQPRTNLYYEV